MIHEATIHGKKAIVVYLDDNFVPVDGPDKARLLKVTFENGDRMYLSPESKSDDDHHVADAVTVSISPPPTGAGGVPTPPPRPPTPAPLPTTLPEPGAGALPHDPGFSQEAMYRAKNPFNVNLTDYGKQLGGEITPPGGIQHQPRHATFPTMMAGFFAGMEALQNRYSRGDTTLHKLFNVPGRQWSTMPGASKIYARALGIGEHDDLQLHDPNNLKRFTRTLIQHEGKTGQRILQELPSVTSDMA
jgi:hypothetical protein